MLPLPLLEVDGEAVTTGTGDAGDCGGGGGGEGRAGGGGGLGRAWLIRHSVPPTGHKQACPSWVTGQMTPDA